jgi:hypothetical protein
MSQPPQGGQPPQGPDDAGPQDGTAPRGPGPQNLPPQPGRPGQPPYTPQGYPPAGGQPPQGYPQQGYPPQGYPQQPGAPQQGYPPQQPYAGGPGPQGAGYGVPPGGSHPGGTQPYQAGPYGPYGRVPGQPGQPGEKKKRTTLFVLIGAGALALILAVVAVAVNVGGRSDDTAGGGAGATSAPVAKNASDAVQGFLEAVAANDAERALTYTDAAPADKTFLTDAALQASSKIAPLTAISVPPVTDEYAYKVPATFNLGDKTYARDFEVKKDGDTWKVGDGVSDVDVSYQRQRTLAMVVNGTKLTADTLSVLPGTYVFTTGSRWVSWGSKNVMTVAKSYPTLPTGIKPTLTKAGSDEVLAKTRAAFRSCLDQHKLRPKGCPNRINDTLGIKVKESTVRWRVTKDPFRNAKIDLDYSDPTVATGSFYPDYRIKFTGTKSGVTGPVDTDVIGLSSFEAVADLSKDKVTVKLT